MGIYDLINPWTETALYGDGNSAPDGAQHTVRVNEHHATVALPLTTAVVLAPAALVTFVTFAAVRHRSSRTRTRPSPRPSSMW
ncbi:hypothetical protein ACFV0T_12950 [Streptomyces sp. NPDC059582]|uniref:hypothetical protein n=1 Tax=Streptomyces sp. NPDC059582 TaxID=3346875 RepID=UPI00368892E6